MFTLPTKPQGLRWLYVDFNSYFASVEQQINPALRGKPVAVVAVETDSTCAIAASYEAKAYGVKTGTPIYQAKKMCPGLICVLARHEHYVEFHQRIQEDAIRPRTWNECRDFAVFIGGPIATSIGYGEIGKDIVKEAIKRGFRV